MYALSHGRRLGSAQVAVVLIVAIIVVAGGGVLAWYLLDKPASEFLEPKTATTNKGTDKKTETVTEKRPTVPRPRVINNSIDMKLVLVPAGKFKMGSPDTEKERDGDESPVREIEITQPFYLGVYEVTQEEYTTVMGRAPSGFSFQRGNQERLEGVKNTLHFPVDSVTWNDAVEFCKKLTDRIGERNAHRVYRLPTEAEWEYACRAGTTSVFATGNTLGGKQANFNGEEPYGGAAIGPNLKRTCNVGSYPPNDFGLCDMHGNLYEWCQDFFAAYPAGPAKDPSGPEEGEYRVLRGGSWLHGGKYCRSAERLAGEPALQEWYIGFRVAATR